MTAVESPASQKPAPTAASTGTTPQGESAPADEATSVSPWWLLAAVVAVAAVAAAVVSGRRRHQWDEQLRAAEGEVEWFARVLVPDLRAADRLDRAMGGWIVSSARARSAEDRLTALEASARNDADRLQARTLRDALRLARGRLDNLAAPGVHESWRSDLEAVSADLEAALSPRVVSASIGQDRPTG